MVAPLAVAALVRDYTVVGDLALAVAVEKALAKAVERKGWVMVTLVTEVVAMAMAVVATAVVAMAVAVSAVTRVVAADAAAPVLEAEVAPAAAAVMAVVV